MTRHTTIKSFEAIVSDECSAVILGTMPGEQSLAQKVYYGHPDNVFWDIIIRVLVPDLTEEKIENLLYSEKTSILLSNKIALWDVLQFCDRKGNLDSAIRNEIRNDFDAFFNQYKKIKTIFFNGQKAEKYFNSCFFELYNEKGLTKVTLPSTSPSFTLNTFKKLKVWRQVLQSHLNYICE